MTKSRKIEIANLIKTQIVDKCEMTDDIIKQIIQSTVSYSGPADTILGEMLRAHQFIEYRYFNDGDMIDANGNCSNESVETSWKYIANRFCNCVRRRHLGGANIEYETKIYFSNDDISYKRKLELILDNIIEFAIIHPQVFNDNDIDSRSDINSNWTMDVVDMEEDYDYYINYINGKLLR